MKYLFSLVASVFFNFVSYIIMIPSFLIFFAGIYALKDGISVLELVATCLAGCMFLFGLWLQVRS